MRACHWQRGAKHWGIWPWTLLLQTAVELAVGWRRAEKTPHSDYLCVNLNVRVTERFTIITEQFLNQNCISDSAQERSGSGKQHSELFWTPANRTHCAALCLCMSRSSVKFFALHSSFLVSFLGFLLPLDPNLNSPLPSFFRFCENLRKPVQICRTASKVTIRW